MRGAGREGRSLPRLVDLDVKAFFDTVSFDLWISREYPGVRFERFADDALLSAFSGISPHFRPRRHLLSAADYRQVMAGRFAVWNEITGATTTAAA